jgi:RHS repeat-associated protein
VDELLAILPASGVVADRKFVHSNHLYSVAALTDNSGNVLERYRYDAYGQRLIVTKGADNTWGTSDDGTAANSAFGNQYGFTGRYLDKETGLWYFRARYYSGNLGRFVSRDPIGYVDGWHLYRAFYVPNSLDPSGLTMAPAPKFCPANGGCTKEEIAAAKEACADAIVDHGLAKLTAAAAVASLAAAAIQRPVNHRNIAAALAAIATTAAIERTMLERAINKCRAKCCVDCPDPDPAPPPPPPPDNGYNDVLDEFYEADRRFDERFGITPHVPPHSGLDPRPPRPPDQGGVPSRMGGRR